MTTNRIDQYTNRWLWCSLFGSPRVIKESSFVSSFFRRKGEVIRRTTVILESSISSFVSQSSLSRKRIQKFSVQLWSSNQRTTEAEEVTDP
jgi:hypothetical protein